MGYSTDFYGSFQIDKPLDGKTFALLKGLAKTRRMKRDPQKLEAMGFGPAESFGVEGEFFYNLKDFSGNGQANDASILDYNRPSSAQPSLWLGWRPNEDGTEIEWDGGEKTYETEAWIRYLIERILAPRGYVLNGAVNAEGEDPEDRWFLFVENNEVSIGEGKHEQNSNKHCPDCGRKEAALEEEGGAFVEIGEYDGKSYEEEYRVDIYKCRSCGARFFR